MRYFDPPEGARILDFGGYVGATAIHYAAKGHNVTTVEGSRCYAGMARTNVLRFRPKGKVEVICGLFEDFHAHAEFDAACCTEVLNMVCDPVPVLAAMRAALKPEGIAFVTVTQASGKHHVRRYTVDTLAAQMSDAGFTGWCEPWDDGIHTPQIMFRGRV